MGCELKIEDCDGYKDLNVQARLQWSVAGIDFSVERPGR